MPTARSFQFKAVNISAQSDNKIHSDDGARRYGFRGGLVSGTAIFAYACDAVRQLASDAWVEGGFTGIRFRAPIYDGEIVTVEVVCSGGAGSFAVTNPGGQVCAEGTFSDGVSSDYSGQQPRLRLVEPWGDLRPMIDATFVDVDQMPSVPQTLRAEDASAFLESVGLDPAPYIARGLVPASFLARLYISVVHANFRWAGPGIHATAQTQMIRPLQLGEEVVLRSRVDSMFARNGQRFWAFEIGHYGADGLPSAWNFNSAVYDVAVNRTVGL